MHTGTVAPLESADGMVSLVEGQTFALSGRSGDMHDDLPNGLFVLDTRVLSRWELHVNGHRIEPLAVDHRSPFSARFAGRSAPDAGHRAGDGDLVVFRERTVGRGMREEIRITNHGTDPAPLTVELLCDVDFADLVEVKEGRVRHRGRHSHEIDPDALRFGHRGEAVDKDVKVSLSEPATVEPGIAAWRCTLGPESTWRVSLEVTVELAGQRIEPRFDVDGPDEPVPAKRLREWHAELPRVATDHAGFATVLARSGADLGALRVFDPEHLDLPLLAAGAPWLMTVFGRDSLLTAWMALIADPSLAHGALETLARFQGTDVDPRTGEEPGKILHEVRFGGSGGLSLGDGHVNYDTVDATPLFVMLLGELRRWDPADELVARLLPHADRALEWIETAGDPDGDGYVEYSSGDERGRVNQGWKDSWNAIRFADGRFAERPIALAEVQGYVYAAYVARAHFAREAGDDANQARYTAKARALRDRFNEDFWSDEHGTYVLALDADGKQVDAVCSNVGHCLWTGIVDPDRARLVADRLLAPDSFSGFGVRTMASSMGAYNPVSYHGGSVWPHDNAIVAAGLTRYGFVEHAHRVIEGQLRAADLRGGALPELFAGFGDDELAVPAGYPTSCSPHALAAASPLLWLRTLLRLDPWAPRGEVWVDPQLPTWMRRLRVDGIRVAGRTLSVEAYGGDITISGGGGLRVVQRPRPPQTATLDQA